MCTHIVQLLINWIRVVPLQNKMHSQHQQLYVVMQSRNDPRQLVREPVSLCGLPNREDLVSCILGVQRDCGRSTNPTAGCQKCRSCIIEISPILGYWNWQVHRLHENHGHSPVSAWHCRRRHSPGHRPTHWPESGEPNSKATRGRTEGGLDSPWTLSAPCVLQKRA